MKRHSEPIMDVDASVFKKQRGNSPNLPRTDRALDPDPTYAASGVKRVLDGIIYQSKLLEVFVKRGIAKEYDFRLATEMDAAEKFDDVVFKWKESIQADRVEKWNWRYLQAKHKQDPGNNKITINDLISTSNDNPFSLQKYIVSFYKIKNNNLFKPNSANEKIDLKSFIIITNTDFDFNENLELKKDNSLTKRAQEHNKLINKWKSFFEKEEDLEKDEILYFSSKHFKAEKFKFNENAKTDLTEIIKSSLLKSALQAKGIKYLSSAKEKLEAVKVCNQNDLITRANKAVKYIEKESNGKKRKGEVLKEVKEVLKLKGKVLVENRYMDLEKSIKDLEKTSAKDKNNQAQLDKATKYVLDEANIISNEASNKLNDAKGKLADYNKIGSKVAFALNEDKNKLNNTENCLKKIKAKISEPGITLDDIKEEIKEEVSTNIILKDILDGIKKKTNSDLGDVKETLNKRLGEAISEISVIQVALNDDTLNNYLKEFLEKFRFVTNYPNEKKLGALIKNELRKEFDLLNADLVSDSFEREMLDFLKSYDNGKAKFYSWKDGKEFFKALKGKINTLMSSGISKVYPEKLRVYGIRFRENLEVLNGFLSNKVEFKKIQIFHVSTQATRLSAIKVLKTLESDELKSNYNYLGKEDGYIFICLGTLLRQNTQDYIINSFDKQGTHDLLVIECQSKTQGNINGLYDRLKDILDKNMKKKVILIAHGRDLLARKFKDSQKGKYRKENEQTFFEDLDEDSQNKILDKRVNLQGKYIGLNELIDKNSAGKIIDEASLSRLLEGENIVIGDQKAFSSIGYVKDYYIERKFHFWKKPSSGQSDQEISKDKVIKSHPGIYGDLCWGASQGNSSALNDIDKDYKEKVFSKPDPDKKVVIIANVSGMGKSTVLTSIANMMKDSSPALWVVRVNLNDYAVDEKQPQSLHNIKFKESETNNAIEFVLKITVSGAPDKKDTTNINLQRKLFKLGLEKPKDDSGQHPKIVILFDGFDEISPNYKPNATKLIKALKESRVTQLWVTTRVHEKAHLEKELESQSYILYPLTEREQINFLCRFWKWNLKFYKDLYSQKVYERTYEVILEHLREIKLPDILFISQLTEDISNILKDYPLEAVDKLEGLRETIDELDFSYYAKEMLDQWNKSIADRGEFTLVPLHLKMLTEVVFEKKFQLPKDLRLFDLYDNFIKVKFDIYHQDKNKIRKGNVGADDTVKRDLDNLGRVHHELALKLLFPKEHEKKSLPSLNEQSRFKKQELARVGLLTLKGDVLEFIHQSFAEYFVSEYLVKNLENEQLQGLLLEKILVENNYELIRKFFNDKLEKSPTSIKLTEAGKKSIAKDLGKSCYKQTFLHIMAQEGNCGICEFLFQNLQDDAELLKELITKSYNYCLTALHLAIWGDHDKIVKQLLYNSLKLDPETFKNNILKLESGEGTPLSLAAQRGHNNIVTLVLNFVKDHVGNEFLREFVLETDILGETALYLASDEGHTETVKTLLNFVKEHLREDTLKQLVLKANKSNQKDEAETQTALHRAAKKGYIEIINEIINEIRKYPETLKELVLKTDYYGATALLEAVEMDKNSFSAIDDRKRKTISALLQNINDPKALEDLAILSIYGDARKDPEKIVDNLLSSIENNSEIYKNLTSIQNRLSEVKMKRESLSEAICLKDKDKVQKILNESHAYIKELVLENGGQNGQTTLINAVDSGQSEIAEKIMESIKNYPRILEELVLKVYGYEKETALHRAARHDYHQTVLKMVNFVKDHLGKQSLKKALLKPKIKSDGTTAIYAAHYRNCHQTVKVILEFEEKHLPEILEEQVKEIGGMQVTLKWAEGMGFLDLKQRLLDRIGSQVQRKLALLKAAEDGNSTVLKTLLDGVNNDVQALKELLTANDNHGNTLLDLAPSDTAYILLNWVKDNLKDDPSHTMLKKLVLASGKEKGRDTNLLNWVKENLEKVYPGTLKKLLMKAYFQGKTALSSGFFDGRIYSALELLHWVKNNANEETLNDLVLAGDNSGRTALHSAAFDPEFNYKSEAVIDLLKALKDHPKILKELLLKPDNWGKIVLHVVAKEMHYEKYQENLISNWGQKTEKEGEPMIRAILESVKDDAETLKDLVLATDKSKNTALDLAVENNNKYIVVLLKAQYDEIASSLLKNDTNIADFSDDQLHLLEKHVNSNDYNGNNKTKILQTFERIRSERFKIWEEVLPMPQKRKSF